MSEEENKAKLLAGLESFLEVVSDEGLDILVEEFSQATGRQFHETEMESKS